MYIFYLGIISLVCWPVLTKKFTSDYSFCTIMRNKYSLIAFKSYDCHTICILTTASLSAITTPVWLMWLVSHTKWKKVFMLWTNYVSLHNHISHNKYTTWFHALSMWTNYQQLACRHKKPFLLEIWELFFHKYDKFG